MAGRTFAAKMPILKFAHIAAMFSSFLLLWATDLLFWQAARRGDVPGLRTIGRYGARIVPIGVVLFFVGIGFGVVNAVVGGWNLLAPWLLITYALVAVMLVMGLFIETPMLDRLAAKANEEADATEPSPELRQLMADRRPILYDAISFVIWIAVIYVMVVKPLS